MTCDSYPLGRDPEWEQRRSREPLQPAPRYIPHRTDPLSPGWDPTSTDPADYAGFPELMPAATAESPSW